LFLLRIRKRLFLRIADHVVMDSYVALAARAIIRDCLIYGLAIMEVIVEVITNGVII
jgi:hypothetical protein